MQEIIGNMADYHVRGYPVRGFRFACPACGEPWSNVKEPIVDIHGGHEYHCEVCGEAVIFFVYTKENLPKPPRHSHDGERGGRTAATWD